MAQLRSSLGRPIVWGLTSNRLAVIGSAIGAAAVAIVRLLADRPVTVGNLFGTFGGVFLAWAVAREIDPDDSASATVAMAFAAFAILQFGFASLWLVLGVLLGVRLIVGSVGVSLGIGDVVVLSGLAAYLGYRYAAWGIIAVLAVGAGIAGRRNRLATGLVVIAAGSGGLAFSSAFGGFVMPGFETWAVLSGAVASAVILGVGPAPVSVTDVHARPLQRDRLVMGQVAAAIAVVLVALQTGLAAALGPVAAALLGGAAVRLVRGVKAGGS